MPRIQPKTKVTANSKTAEVTSRKRTLESGLLALEMDKEFPLLSPTEKRNRNDVDAINPACLATPETEPNSASSRTTSSASGNEILSSSFSSSTSSNQHLSPIMASCHKKGSNKAHIVFNAKKQIYLQDSLDPIDENVYR